MFNFTRTFNLALMIKRILIFSAVLLAFFLTGEKVLAQKSEIYRFKERDFYKGMNLFEKEKYGSAKKFFADFVDQSDVNGSDLRAEAQYYLALSAIELGNLDAEYLVFEFVRDNPENPLKNNAFYKLAGYMYQKKDYAKAIRYYDMVDRYYLGREQLSEYYFQKGYSFYMRNDMDSARVSFYEIKDMESKYTSPALYYYSHIAYDQGNYATALNGFLKLVDDETFAAIAPYYIAQIYYLQKNFEKVIEFALPMMDSVSDKREAEMSKIIGESYFYLENYVAALPFLQTYQDETGQISIGDKYQLAYAYYMTGDYNKAATLFERISLNNSEISQSALYHLADSYIHLGEKNKARVAFASAGRMDFNPAIKEDALFNYAKVTYELSYSPFNEAVRAFNNYIVQYPVSRRVDEAYQFLLMAYMNTRNYRMALESLEKIKNKDEDILRAYQKVAFYRGLELFTNQRFDDAIGAFAKALENGKYDPMIKARTLYWLAESYYKISDAATAEEYYSLFQAEPLSVRTDEFRKLKYSMGYLEFSRKNYSQAESWFREYVNLENDKSAVSYADAWNRLGDIKFIQTSYWQAIEDYDKVISLRKADVEYAYFQKAFCLGLVDRPQRKIETLQELLAQYPHSTYTDDALFETGKTYVILDQPENARKSYTRIVNEFPGSSYLNKTLIQLGLYYKNQGNNSEALKYYKQVVNDYPGTPEASVALSTIKDIYVNMNNVDAYLGYVNDIGQGVSMSEQDSLVYVSAENIYLQGDCEKAILNLDNYLKKYPRGAYLINANYYRADCLLKQGKEDDAYSSLLFIVDQPTGIFTEPALLAASRIAFKKKDYNKAAGLYTKLVNTGENKSNIAEAQIGLMRSYFQLNEYQNTIEAARIVLLQDKLDEYVKKEATYLIASAYLQQNDTPAAYDWFEKISGEVSTQMGAEAKYRTAQISYQRGEVDKAEKLIFEFIGQNTPHHFWMGKSFLLLADIYLSRNDDFQAVQTLESVINYYTSDDDGIKEAAVKKKKEITGRVDLENQPAPPDTMEIFMDNRMNELNL